MLNAKSPIVRFREDKSNGQLVSVHDTVFGTTIRPSKLWTPFCERIFRSEKANGVWLDDISIAPHGTLAFAANLPKCARLTVERGEQVSLSPLMDSPCFEELQIGTGVRVAEFDLTRLPKLKRLQVPVCKPLMSAVRCVNLVSLILNGGNHPGVLGLEALPSLEELICIGVGHLRRIAIAPKVSLRSLELTNLRYLEGIAPHLALTRELRVVVLNRVPRIGIEWLRQAQKVECIALRIGKIPSIKCLEGLQRLQVLDLFGSKVLDGDLSLRDSLRNELDARLWGDK